MLIEENKSLTNNNLFGEFKKFINFFSRNKKQILIITSFFFFLSLIYGFQKKKIWEGGFEIVLDNDTEQQTGAGLLDGFGGIKLKNFDDFAKPLKTEVGILNSPSVLLPIFDFVKNKKQEADPELNLNFQNWKKNLSVNLKEDTSILDIKYKDENKKLIIPVLEKIAASYQKYSGRSKKRTLLLGQKYLEDQIETFKVKSSNSLKELQKYALEKDLAGSHNQLTIQKYALEKDLAGPQNQLTNGGGFLNTNLGIEVVRAQAANRIKNIDMQIKEFTNAEEDFEQILYFALSIPTLKESGLPERLSEVEEELIQLSSKYVENDRAIKIIKEKRKSLIDLLKKRSIGYLKAERIIQVGIVEAAKRPKEVLLKYKELSRVANRDENTLVELENNLRLLKLDQAKIEDPWELISQPNLKEYPISPKKKKIALLSIIAGLFTSIIFAYSKEKVSDLIYEEDTLEELLGLKIIEKVNHIDGSFKKNNKEIFLNEILEINSKKLYKFLKIGNNDLDDYKNYLEILSNVDMRFKVEESINKPLEEDIYVIVTKLGNVSSSEIASFRERLAIKKLNPIGILLFVDN